MKNAVIFAISSIFSVSCPAATWPELTKDAEFEGRWMCNSSLCSFTPISKTLVSNHVKSCGVFYWAESKDYEDIFLVACYSASADLEGEPTSLYVVKVDSKKMALFAKSVVKHDFPWLRPAIERVSDQGLIHGPSSETIPSSLRDSEWRRH